MTPLFKKLNLSFQASIHVLNAPASFEPELAALEGVEAHRSASGKITFGLAFAITLAELDALCTQLVKSADGDAILWIAYPKRTSRKYACEFNRDSEWAVLGHAGFEPVRQVAIDQDWSALRFRRTEYIKSLTRTKLKPNSESGKSRARKTT